jgi:hypothetical protein
MTGSVACGVSAEFVVREVGEGGKITSTTISDASANPPTATIRYGTIRRM